MASKTKAQLEAENAAQRDIIAALGAEIAQYRELLAAISECADTVPVSEHTEYRAEWLRSTHVLSKIKVLSRLDENANWTGYLAYAAGELRACAAEDVGYKVFREPVSDEDATAILADAIANGTPVIAVDLAQWHGRDETAHLGDPGSCPSCGSEIPAERCYVPGRTGMPVDCGDDWHEFSDVTS